MNETKLWIGTVILTIFLKNIAENLHIQTEFSIVCCGLDNWLITYSVQGLGCGLDNWQIAHSLH
jgi:hypothetical protein